MGNSNKLHHASRAPSLPFPLWCYKLIDEIKCSPSYLSQLTISNYLHSSSC